MSRAELAAPRLARIVEALGAHGVAAGALAGPGHVLHATGYARYFSGPCAVVVDRDGRRTLVAPAVELDAARADAAADAVVPYGPETLGMVLDPLPALADAIAAAAPAGALGLASEVAGLADALARATGAAPAALDAALHEVRLVKDAEELGRIAASYALCERGQAAVASAAAPGAREIDLFGLAHVTAQGSAGRPVGFVCDLVSGPRSGRVACPTEVAGVRALADGDVVIADVAIGDGYWGDSARTLVVGAHAEAEAARAGIAEVLHAARPLFVPGAVCADVFAAIAADVARRFPDGAFPHHAGHGVGVSVFEDPHLIPADRTPLEEGMVLAVEPGAYWPRRFGVRLEELLVVTAAGGVPVGELSPPAASPG